MIDYTFLDVEKPDFFDQIAPWAERTMNALFPEVRSLNYIFCSDQHLLKINQDALAHDYFTDIITFDLRDQTSDPLEADIFISIDRVRENAPLYNCTFAAEFRRVMVHGLLHLAGLNDSTEEEKQVMRDLEKKYIDLY